MPFYKEGGGGTLLDSLSEGLENVEKITTQSKVEDVVKNTSPLAADFRKSEAEGETRNIRSSVVSNSKLNLRSERCHLMRGRNGRFAPQNDMVLNNPSRFTPHSSHRKSAFTMAEIIIVIAIVGFVCMALMSVIRTAMPDYITVMKRKCYQILEDKVTQMYYDDDLYVRGTKRGFGNLQNIVHNGKTYGGNTKFCELFASTMNKWGGTTCEEDKMTFKTADNVYWYLPVTDFSKGYAVVKFDVNGSKKPNCEYDAATCPKPDTFRYYVLGNGKISEHEPKPEEFDYCIKTIITGSGSVLPSAEYCGLKNGTYELTSVPATGWSSPWAGNKKEVTVLDSDEVVYLNFTKDPEPEPTTPTEPTVPTTPTGPSEPEKPLAKTVTFRFNIIQKGCDFYDITSVNNSMFANTYYNFHGTALCLSKFEIYVNDNLEGTLKMNPMENDNAKGNDAADFLSDKIDISFEQMPNHYQGGMVWVKFKDTLLSKNVSNNIKIKFIPRELFGIDKEEITFSVNYDDLAKNNYNYNHEDITVNYNAKQANSDGWLELDGTYFKLLSWPSGKSTIRPSETYDCTVYEDVMKEGMEKACSAVGGHPANKEQMNKFRRATANVESIKDFGCRGSKNQWNIFGLGKIQLLDASFPTSFQAGYCPAFNTETTNSRYTGGSSHNPILCVK